MKVPRFSQRHGCIAVLLVLSFVCAIPLLVANTYTDSKSKPDEDGEWWAYAWVHNQGGSEVGDMTISRSSHRYVIWNMLEETENDDNELQFQVEFAHEVRRENWAGIWADGSWVFTKDVPASTYFASTTQGRTEDWVTVDASFTLKAYTAVRRGPQSAQTNHIVRHFTTGENAG